VGALHSDPDADVAVPVHDGRRHFHHAVWRQRALPRLEAAFAAGERAPRRVAATLRVVEVVVERPETLRDVDDPAAFAAERAHQTG
jgi:molybdopterin-guanine dinucleotide biosynthesis protein A